MAKNGNLLLEELEGIYVRAERRKSDYDFLEDEFRFLINLADRYFVGIVITDSTRLDKLKTVAEKLVKLDEERKTIAEENRLYIAYLSRLIRNEEVFDPEACREEQSDLESDHHEFFKKFRNIKMEMFHLAEEIFK